MGWVGIVNPAHPMRDAWCVTHDAGVDRASPATAYLSIALAPLASRGLFGTWRIDREGVHGERLFNESVFDEWVFCR